MAEKPKKKSGRQNYDWNAIKHEYVTDPKSSLRKIAKDHGINYATVAKKSKADDWFATRKKHQSNVISKAISKTEEKQANELARELNFLNTMKDRMEDMLKDADQFKRHIVQEDLSVKEIVAKKYDTRAMRDSFQMLEMMEKLTRSMYEMQKIETIQKHQLDVERLQIERERLALEKERLAFRNGNMDDDDNYGVVLLPEILPEVMPNE